MCHQLPRPCMTYVLKGVSRLLLLLLLLLAAAASRGCGRQRRRADRVTGDTFVSPVTASQERPRGAQESLGVDLEGFGAFWGRPRRSPGRQKAVRGKPQRPPNDRGRRLEEEGAESRFIQHLSAHIAICGVGGTLEVRRCTYESTKSYRR